MRCYFADDYEFRAWAESVANAVRLYAGRIDRIPPYALPSILRDPSAAVPAADTVAPELVTDWGALVDELNTAITEVFPDAPATFTAYDMPAIIAAHAGGNGGPLTIIEAGTVYIDGTTGINSRDFGEQEITPPTGATICMLIVDLTPISTVIPQYPGTLLFRLYGESVEKSYFDASGKLFVSLGLISSATVVTYGTQGKISIRSGGIETAIFTYSPGPGQTFTGTGNLYIAFK